MIEDQGPPQGWLGRIEDWFLTFLVSLMLVLAASQIVLRTFFSSGWLWADPLLRHLVLWAGFWGAMSASRNGRHIHIDALIRLLPAAYSRHLIWFNALFSACTCAFLAWIGLRFVLDEKAYGLSAFLDIPSWYAQTIFPLAFAVMAWRFARQAFESLRKKSDFD